MKILCVKQYKCTVFVNSQQACINGNSMLLGTSSTCVKAAECTETSHGKRCRRIGYSNRWEKVKQTFYM